MGGDESVPTAPGCSPGVSDRAGVGGDAGLFAGAVEPFAFGSSSIGSDEADPFLGSIELAIT